MESPRMVTAADRLCGDFSSSTHTFPAAMFASSHKGNNSSTTDAVATLKAKKGGPSAPWRNKDLRLPYLALLASCDGRKQTTPNLAPRNRKSKKGDLPWNSIGGSHQLSHQLSHHLVPQRTSLSEQSFNMLPNERKQDAMVAEKPRSRAIAIITKNRNVDSRVDIEAPCASAEEMYDWATWRMYNRITQHRRRFPIKQPYTHEPIRSDAMNEASRDGDYKTNEASHGETPQQDYYLDGEVFELEL